MSSSPDRPAPRRPVAILVCGRTVPPVAARCGDFADWFRAGLGLDERAAPAIDLAAGEPLPAVEALGGVAVTGSPAMVTEEEPWSVAAERWLGRAHAAGLPLLGVCYGHQLLARALGGEAGWNPAGREIGSVPLTLTAAADDDPLLGGLESPLIVQQSHSQSVLRLPAGAVLLGSSALDPHQAFRVGPTSWGLQFHPEFDARIVRGYIAYRRDAIAAEGLDPEALDRGARDDPRARQVLARFAAVAAGARGAPRGR